MRLRVIVSPTLTLKKEEKVFNFGDEFEVEEARGVEILKATFNGKPVVEFVSSGEVPKTDEELKNKVAELEESNKNLIAEKEELEKKIEELEESNKNLIAEKEKLENNELENPTNKKNTKKEGEDK